MALQANSGSNLNHDFLLSCIAGAWDRLAANASSPMQHYIWSKACLDTLNADDRLYIIPPDSTDDVIAFAPLIRRRHELLPRLILPGSDDLGEPMDLLYIEDSALKQVARRLVETGLPIFLQRLPATSPAVEAIKDAYRGRGWVVSRASESSPTLKIDASWVNPDQCLKAGRRSDLRRMRRNAEKLGPVSFEVHEGPPAAVYDLLQKAFAIENKSWKGREGTSLALDSKRSAFFTLYATEAAKRGMLRVFFLRIGEQLAAMQIAVEFGGALWLFKVGYDESFKRCAPGQLLMLEAVRYGLARALDSIEFLGSDEPWTKTWTKHVREYVSLGAYPANAIGASVFAADVSSWAMKRVRYWLNPKKK